MNLFPNPFYKSNDPSRMKAALDVLLQPGQAVELRALEVNGDSRTMPGTVSGYFTDTGLLVTAAVGLQAKGIYITLNEVDPALLARATNRARKVFKEPTTSDADVVRRRWLLVDADPVRPSGVSSSEPEHAAALEKVRGIREALKAEGWPDPVVADSGNGGHLLYRIELPADDAGLVQRCLNALADRFGEDAVEIDRKVFNASRITKLYGTYTRKGDDTPERPHRMAQILEVPPAMLPVSVDLLESLGSRTAHVAGPVSAGPGPVVSEFDLGQWLIDHGLQVTEQKPWNGGTIWTLKVCPWNDSHRDASAFVTRFADGRILAKCHHNSCTGNDWESLCRLVGGDAEDVGRPKGPITASVAVSIAAPQRVADACLPYRPFPVHVLPDVVRQYVENGVETVGCPDSYVGVPVLACLGAAIGNSRRIVLKSGWSEPPVVWAAIIGNSGERKSPALQHAVGPTERRQAQWFQKHDVELRAHKQAHAQYARDTADWKQKGRKGDPPAAPPEPERQRFICGDTTIEALAELLQKNPRGMLMYRDELAGWIKSFDAYRGGLGGDAEKWLELHPAGTLTVDRKTGDAKFIHVPRAAVCVTGGIQPKTLAEVLGEKHFNNGLAARLLLTLPPPTSGRWSDRERDPRVTDRMDALVSRLYELGFDPAEPRPTPVYVGLSPPAKESWIAFHDAHDAEMRSMPDDRLMAAWSKLMGYAARFALIVHCVEQAAPIGFGLSGSVGQSSVEAGITLARWFCHETRRVYAALGGTVKDAVRRKTVEAARLAGGVISCRELMRAGPCFTTREAAEAAVEELVHAGVGRWESPPATGKPGRRGERRFRLNDGYVGGPPAPVL